MSRKELVNEWSAPLPAPRNQDTAAGARIDYDKAAQSSSAPAAQVLRSLVDLFGSAKGRAIGMHAPVELRFSAVTGGEDLLLSPGAKYGHLLGRRDHADDLVMWFEPIMCVLRPPLSARAGPLIIPHADSRWSGAP